MSNPHAVEASVRRVFAAIKVGGHTAEGLLEQGTAYIAQQLAQGATPALAELRLSQLLTGQGLGTAPAQQPAASSRPRGAPAPPPPPDLDDDAVDEAPAAEVFATYECAPLPPGAAAAPRHPGEISEASLLASVPLPALAAPPGDALAGCAARRELSDLQIEGALHAVRRHGAIANGARAGFFLGDGAGVGKGRQVSAVILDSVARGRGRHLWFSVAPDLRVDAERDLTAIGCHVPVIDGCKSLDAAAGKAFGGPGWSRAVLFSTYATLVSAASSRKTSRLDQLVAWCGGAAFTGCLVFDEAHKAKNFDAKKEDASTKVSRAVKLLQDKLPLARVVYASATGVSEISNMAYAERLGLWGAGTPFADFKTFAATLEKRGVGALELLALELKSSGAYVSRGLSWQRCEFEGLHCPLDVAQRRDYDAMAAWWRALRRALDHALKRTNSTKGGLARQRFWGAQLRFFKEVQTACKVPFVVARAKRALADGQAVVVGLQATGEAGLRDVMAEAGKRTGDAAPGLVAAAKSAAKKFVVDFFPVAESVDDDGPGGEPDDATIRRLLATDRGPAVTDAQVAQWRAVRAAAMARRGEPFEDLVQLKAAILARLDGLAVPPSPLDDLIDQLGGPGCVAEMTGRATRVVRKANDRYKYEARCEANDDGAVNLRERAAFQAGKKTVAIISDAASTGVSLHAARGTGAEDRRRLHVTLELAWSADKAIQQLGRSHRANQASAPVYSLLSTDLGGEARFASAVAKRLASLGALTKGDRRAASGQDLSEFDVDTKHGRTALQEVARACRDPRPGQIAPGVDVDADAEAKLREAIQGGRVHAADARRAAAAARATADAFAPYEYEVPAAAGDHQTDAEALSELARHAYDRLDVDPKKDGDVRVFLNRLQAASVADQALLFEYFQASFRAVVRAAKANGTLDAGVADLRATSVTVDRVEVIGRDAVSGAETRLTEVTLDRGASFAAALAKRDAGLGDDDRRASVGASTDSFRGTGFYQSRRPLITTGKTGYLLAVRKANARNLYVITRPNTGTATAELNATDLRARYVAHAGTLPDASEADAAALRRDWSSAYEAANTSDRGGRLLRMGLVSGAVLPFWTALERTVAERGADMTAADRQLKVVRLTLDDGTKIVGIRFPPIVLGTLRAQLREAHRLRAAHAAAHVRAEPPDPVDAKALRAANTPQQRKINSFFTKAPAGKAPAAPRPAPASKAPAPKKPRAAAASSKRKASSSSGGGSISSFFSKKKPKDTAAPPPAPAPPPAAAPAEFVECPACTAFVDAAKMNEHLDSECPGLST